MLFRRSWGLVIHTNRRGNIFHRQSIRKQFLSTQPQTSTNNSNLIWKLIGGSSLIIGVPYLVYRSSSKSNPYSQDHQTTPHQRQQQQPISTSETINLIENLPESVPYLIIGGGPSGFSASRTIRSNDPTARVLIVTEENHYPYTRTPLTKELWFSGLDENKLSFKQFNGKERSIYFEHEEFYLPLKEFDSAPHGGVSVVKLHKVIRLDVTNRKAYLDSGQMISYGKCIIATGTVQKNFKAFEEASKPIQDKVILYRTPEDYQRLRKLMPELNSLTIIGNGFTASELAFSLIEYSKKIKSNVKINHVFEQDGVLDEVLPTYLSRWCTERIKDENVNVIPKTSIENVRIDKNQLLLKLTNGSSLYTDICIVDAGSEPNVELARTSNLEIDNVHGGIMSNAELQVRSNLWATGDVASFFDQKYGRRRDCHHDNAIYTGRIAGENASNPLLGKPYKHHSRFWSDLGADIGFEAIGLIDASLPTFAMFAKDDSKNERDKYQRGVLFYLKENIIVGIILWNIFDIDNMHIARQVLHDGFENQDLNEVAKLFSLYPAPLPPSEPEV